MLKRTLTAAALIILLIPVLLYSDTLLLPVTLAFLSVSAVFEVARCVGLSSRRYLSKTIPAYIIAGCLPFLQYYINDDSDKFAFISFFIYVLIFIIYSFAVFKYYKGLLSPYTVFISMLFYIVIPAICAVAIVGNKDGNGMIYLPLVVVGSWVTDTAAYLVGCCIGRHKLAPHVSPHKTIEGAVGGVVGCCAGFLLYGLIVGSIKNFDVNYMALFVSGIATSVVSQMGDLIASYVKRRFGIKDYGKLFPGHGGVLDRFDSMLAVAPFLFILTRYLSYFN
ncbi:MAG: CDP-archaeol synthase [Clostridiales bacterium]|nr:CDP-archaeol synthase [Clostridiales bacterium]